MQKLIMEAKAFFLLVTHFLIENEGRILDKNVVYIHITTL